jgi:predicted nucleic acid-binding protein
VIAIDANIAVKWYIPEQDSPRAEALLTQSAQFVAPSLIRIEVCAAINRRVRMKELSSVTASANCEDWFTDLTKGSVRLIPDEELTRRAVEISLKILHNVQDSLYLAAAEFHSIPLITADTTFHERALSHYPNIHLLSQWQAN